MDIQQACVLFRITTVPAWATQNNSLSLPHLKCSVKMHDFYCLNLQQKEQHFLLYIFFRWKNTTSLYIRFLSTCFCDRRFFSLTEMFVGDKYFFLWQKLFLWPKCVSLTETWTEFCFSVMENRYMISKENFLWEIGVSIISDNIDKKFVEPWCLLHIRLHSKAPASRQAGQSEQDNVSIPASC